MPIANEARFRAAIPVALERQDRDAPCRLQPACDELVRQATRHRPSNFSRAKGEFMEAGSGRVPTRAADASVQQKRSRPQQARNLSRSARRAAKKKIGGCGFRLDILDLNILLVDQHGTKS